MLGKTVREATKTMYHQASVANGSTTCVTVSRTANAKTKNNSTAIAVAFSELMVRCSKEELANGRGKSQKMYFNRSAWKRSLREDCYNGKPIWKEQNERITLLIDRFGTINFLHAITQCH